jgi:hypothetical protein
VEQEPGGAAGQAQVHRRKFMLIFRGGAVSRDDVSPSELQAHVARWYRWSDVADAEPPLGLRRRVRHDHEQRDGRDHEERASVK